MNINLVNKKWERIWTLQSNHIPRTGELVCTDKGEYYVVIRVIHSPYKYKRFGITINKVGVSLVVEKFAIDGE